jgi:hypothetical protein
MKNITKISVFDFDGTLVDTPLPEFGKKEYKEKTGEDWPFPGWWGKALSLDMSIFDMPLIKSVISDYQKEKTNPNTCVVMLTGRMVKLGDSVKKILDANNLKFDEYHFNKGGSTDVAKIKTMESLLEKYPNVKELEMWDDRESHFDIFRNWGNELVKTGRLNDFNINVVPANRH